VQQVSVDLHLDIVSGICDRLGKMGKTVLQRATALAGVDSAALAPARRFSTHLDSFSDRVVGNSQNGAGYFFRGAFMDYLRFAKGKLKEFRKRDAAERAAWPPEWKAAWSEEAKSIEAEDGQSREQAERIAQDWATLGALLGSSPDSWSRKSTILLLPSSRKSDPDEGEFNRLPGIEEPAAPESQQEEGEVRDFENDEAEWDQAAMERLLGSEESFAPESQQEGAEPEAFEGSEAERDDPRMPAGVPQGDSREEAPGEGSVGEAGSSEGPGAGENSPQESASIDSDVNLAMRGRKGPVRGKFRPAYKCFGGKYNIAGWITSFVLPCNYDRYIEPFAGGLSVLMTLPPAAEELAIDRDPEVINLYGVLTRRTDEFIAAINPIPYDQQTFEQYRATEPRDELGRAVRFLVVHRFSRDGLGRDYSESDRLRGKRHTEGPIMGDAAAWRSIKVELPSIAERLRNVTFYDPADLPNPGVALLAHEGRSVEGRRVLVYADPTYLLRTRTAKHTYKYNLTDDDHVELLSTALDLAATGTKFFISGYQSEMYRDLLESAGWLRHEYELANHAGQTRTKQRRVECLWESPNEES
jgi:DNA adenine methylase